MVEFKDALQMAKDYYFAKGQQVITKIYEADKMWIFYGGKRGLAKLGGVAITVDKEDGKIGSFLFPSKESFAILKAATFLEIEVA